MPAATALIQPLAWEPPYAARAALKKKERETERLLLAVGKTGRDEGRRMGQARTGTLLGTQPFPPILSCSLIIVLPLGLSHRKSIISPTVQTEAPEKPKVPKPQPTFPEETA